MLSAASNQVARNRAGGANSSYVANRQNADQRARRRSKQISTDADAMQNPIESSGSFGGLESSDLTENRDDAMQKYAKKWREMSEKILRSEMWCAIRKLLDTLPEEVVNLFELLEQNSNIKVEPSARKSIYKQFTQIAATSFGELHAWEVERLLQSDEIGQQLSIVELSQTRLHDIVIQQLKTSSEQCGEKVDMFDFRLFLALVSEVLLQQKTKTANSKAGRHKYLKILFPIDPDTSGKQCWDLVIMVLLVYCSFEVPYSIAFNTGDDTPGSSLSSFEVFGLAIDALFLFDIALTFVTAYDDQGFMVRRLRDISRNYLKTWFLPDVAGSFPFDVVIKLSLTDSIGGEGLGAIQIIRVFKVVRMLRLVRAVKFLNKLNELEKDGYHIFQNFIGIFRALFLMMFIAHLYSTFFILILPDTTDEPSWLNSYQGGRLQDSDNWTRYVVSLYWAVVSLTTMGYGDIIPATHAERLFCILVALTGAVVFSFCMGTIASLISSEKGVDDRWKAKLRSVQEYLDHRGVSGSLQRKIKAYYSLSWRRSGTAYDENAILDEVSKPISKQILQELGKKQRKELPMFQGFDDECVGYIFSRMNRCKFEQGEVIYHRGSVATDMFFITSGNVDLNLEVAPVLIESARLSLHDDNNTCQKSKKLCPGDTFGELALFPDVSETKLRPDTAVAQSWVKAYSLCIGEVDECHRKYPLVIKKLREFCILKAIECRANKLLPVDQIPSSTTGSDIHMNFLISSLQRDLLSQQETRVLKTAVGQNGGEILRLMRYGSNRSAVEIDKDVLQNISFAVSFCGELLYLDHNTHGLTCQYPLSLGFLLRGRSWYRALSSEEVDQNASKRGKKLFGCSLLTFASSDHASATINRSNDDSISVLGSAPFERRDDDGKITQLFASSQNLLQGLHNAVREWVIPASVRDSRIFSETASRIGVASISNGIDLKVVDAGYLSDLEDSVLLDISQNSLNGARQALKETLLQNEHEALSPLFDQPNVASVLGLNLKLLNNEKSETLHVKQPPDEGESKSNGQIQGVHTEDFQGFRNTDLLNEVTDQLEKLVSLIQSTTVNSFRVMEENRKLNEMLTALKTAVSQLDHPAVSIVTSVLAKHSCWQGHIDFTKFPLNSNDKTVADANASATLAFLAPSPGAFLLSTPSLSTRERLGQSWHKEDIIWQTAGKVSSSASRTHADIEQLLRKRMESLFSIDSHGIRKVLQRARTSQQSGTLSFK